MQLNQTVVVAADSSNPDDETRRRNPTTKPETMDHNVVLETDWFVIESVKYFKKIVSYCPSLGRSGEFTFTLPPKARTHRSENDPFATGMNTYWWMQPRAQPGHAEIGCGMWTN